MTPRVSVVMPAYNHAEYVRTAAESVLVQSFGDLELVVTDDGSTDGTGDVIAELGDSRVKFRAYERNRGACDALNDAIERSVGEYIAVLNSDDFFLPSKLSEQVAYLDRHPEVAATFGMARLVDESGAEVSETSHPYGKAFSAENRPRHSWLRHFFFSGNAICHPTAMVRRTCYDQVGLYDRALMQLPDLDMWIRICSTYEIHVSSTVLTGFRILLNDGNVSGQQPQSRVRLLWEQQQVLRRFLRLSPAELTAVFGADLPRASKLAAPDWPAALARVALSIDSIAHHAFALAVLQDDVDRPVGGTDPLELFALTGSKDIYDVLGRQELSRLRLEHDALLHRAGWRGMAPVRRSVAAVRRLLTDRSRFPSARGRGE